MPLACPSRVLSTVPASPMAEPSSVITEGQDTLAAGGEGPETVWPGVLPGPGRPLSRTPAPGPGSAPRIRWPLSARDLFLEL